MATAVNTVNITLELDEGYTAVQIGRALKAAAPAGSTVMIEVGDSDCFNSYLKVTTQAEEVRARLRDALAEGNVTIGPEWKDGRSSLYFYTTSSHGNMHYYYYGVPAPVATWFEGAAL